MNSRILVSSSKFLFLFLCTIGDNSCLFVSNPSVLVLSIQRWTYPWSGLTWSLSCISGPKVFARSRLYTSQTVSSRAAQNPQKFGPCEWSYESSYSQKIVDFFFFFKVAWESRWVLAYDFTNLLLMY